MEEETIETNDSPNVEESVAEDTQEVTTPDGPTLEDYEKLKAEAEKLKETNKRLYARVKEVKPLKTAPLPDDRIADIELKLELKDRGIPLEAMPFIKKNGGLKSLEDPLVKTAVETYTQQLKAEKAVDADASTRSELEKRYSLAEMEKMPLDELEKLVQ